MTERQSRSARELSDRLNALGLKTAGTSSGWVLIDPDSVKTIEGYVQIVEEQAERIAELASLVDPAVYTGPVDSIDK